MTFGLIGFLFAGLAAGIPVVLHMIHRQKVKDLPFPTLRFLRISVEKTRQRKRIHDLLLMLVRMAALLLIALALAKPTLTHLSAFWSAGGDSATVIILDNSASMGTVDRGRVRFRTALGAAEQIMDELGDGDQVALLLAAGPEYPDEGKLDATGDQVRQMLNQWMGAPSDTAGISYEQADLGAQITQARKLLAQSDAANKQIFVLTDRQRLCWDSFVEEKGRGEGELQGQEEEEIGPHPNAAKPQPNRRTDLWSVATDQRSVLRTCAHGAQIHTHKDPNPLPEGEGTDSRPPRPSSCSTPPRSHSSGTWNSTSTAPRRPAAARP